MRYDLQKTNWASCMAGVWYAISAPPI